MIVVKIDPTSDTYIFQIPRRFFDSVVPEITVNKVTDALAEQFVETFKDQIKESLDPNMLTKIVMEKVTNRISSDIEEIISKKLEA